MAATVWKGTLTFGLVSVPIRLVPAARAEKIPLRQLHRKPVERPAPMVIPFREPAELKFRPHEDPGPVLTRVRQSAFREDTGEAVPRSEITRGFEVEKDRYVELPEQEIRDITPRTSTTMEIREFVRIAQIDPVYFESSYYVWPGPGGEKGYSMLWQSLRKTEYVAVAEFAMHRREHVVIVRPGRTGLLAHTMFYENEVRREEEFRTIPDEVTPRELELASRFIEALAAPFEPQKYKDRYRERLEALIESRMEEAGPETAPPPPPKPAVDILAALEQSLKELRKPPVQETRPARKKARTQRTT